MDTLLEINISKYNELFNNLKINIKKNTISAISGPNNCGKTTLIKIIDRLIKTENEIIINDKYIEEYSNEEYSSLVQSVIPEYISFHENTLKEELLYIDSEEAKINYLIKLFKIGKIINKNIKNLNTKELVLFQIIKAISKSNNLVIMDNIDEYFTKEELNKLYKNFYSCIDKYNMTFVITCLNLDSVVLLDELFIIDKGKTKIYGRPLEVLEKDNVLNKIGLELPFMVDLSVKLRDYDLIKEIELSKEKLIEILWN